MHAEMLVTNENVVITESHVMGHSLQWIRIQSGCQFVLTFVKGDVSVIPDISEILIAVCVYNHTSVLITTNAMTMNTGMNVEVRAKNKNVLIY